MVVAGTIGYRTASGGRLMHQITTSRGPCGEWIGRLGRERRYRVFADLERSGRRCNAQPLGSPRHRRIIDWLEIDAMLGEQQVARALAFLRVADHDRQSSTRG